MKVYRATIRNQWKTTPRQKIGPGRRRRVPWKIFNQNFKREAARHD
jgi:hypothetical protein